MILTNRETGSDSARKGHTKLLSFESSRKSVIWFYHNFSRGYHLSGLAFSGTSQIPGHFFLNLRIGSCWMEREYLLHTEHESTRWLIRSRGWFVQHDKSGPKNKIRVDSATIMTHNMKAEKIISGKWNAPENAFSLNWMSLEWCLLGSTSVYGLVFKRSVSWFMHEMNSLNLNSNPTEFVSLVDFPNFSVVWFSQLRFSTFS